MPKRTRKPTAVVVQGEEYDLIHSFDSYYSVVKVIHRDPETGKIDCYDRLKGLLHIQYKKRAEAELARIAQENKPVPLYSLPELKRPKQYILRYRTVGVFRHYHSKHGVNTISGSAREYYVARLQAMYNGKPYYVEHLTPKYISSYRIESGNWEAHAQLVKQGRQTVVDLVKQLNKEYEEEQKRNETPFRVRVDLRPNQF
jgi:hypothetical protein